MDPQSQQPQPQVQSTSSRGHGSRGYLTIGEAALTSGRSVQTIRRLIKLGRLRARRARTPQGFQYLVDREHLAMLPRLTRAIPEETAEAHVTSVPVDPALPHDMAPQKQDVSVVEKKVSPPPAPSHEMDLVTSLHQTIRSLLEHQVREREQFMTLFQDLQARITFLEEQLRTFQKSPKKWYEFFGL